MGFEIGVNLRVTECLDKGDRNYMEDFSKCYFEKVDGSIVFGFFGIFDGHGGREAAIFAKKNLLKEIKKIPSFWCENDDDILSAIKQGFINTHELMWKERPIWSKTISGFDSTAGTTATIVIVRNKKLYIGHVGDSACVLGYSKMMVSRTDTWESLCLTVEHKPSNLAEKKRILKIGGHLANKAGIQRVVWSRPKVSTNRQDNIEGDSIEYEHIPFLAVTRSLGDLWSYDTNKGVYHISPEPDVQCISLDYLEHRCLILGSDGLWSVVSTAAAIELVRICERETERRVFLDPNIDSNFFYNPAAALVKHSISRWKQRRIRADNISVLVVMIDPPGPSMTKRRQERRKLNFSALDTLRTLITDELPSNENFTRLLSQQFLVECNRWRSANEARTVVSSQSGDTYCMTLPSEQIASPSFSPNKDIPTLTIATSNSSDIKTLTTPIKRLSVSDCQDAIMADPHYLKCCIAWINNTKLWGLLSKYFQTRSLYDPANIIKHLNSIGSGISAGHILLILPWIYAARTAFKKVNPALHSALGSVPLFSILWLDLFASHIEPMKHTCTSFHHSSKQAFVGTLQADIVGLLAHYQYLTGDTTELLFQPKDHNCNNELSALRVVTGTAICRPSRRFKGFKLSEGVRLKFLMLSNSLQRKRCTRSNKESESWYGNAQLSQRRAISEKQLTTTAALSNENWLSFCSRQEFVTAQSQSSGKGAVKSLTRHISKNTAGHTGLFRNFKSHLDLQTNRNNLNNSSVTHNPEDQSDIYNSRFRLYKIYKQYLSRLLLVNFK